MLKSIIKRDGTIAKFDRNKIGLVVQKAYVQSLGVEFLSKGFKIGLNIGEYVEFECKDLSTVEQIQDIVINELYTINTKVAHNYQNFREKKSDERKCM